MIGGWTSDNEELVRALFDTLDDDRTGEIDVERVMTLIWGMGIKIDETEIKQRIITAVNRQQQQQQETSALYNIDLVVSVIKELPTLRHDDDSKNHHSQEDELEEWFQLLDQDGKGYITEIDLKHLAEEMGEPQSLEQIRQMMIPFDRDVDGKWNFNDFCQLMMTKTNGSRKDKR
mmetsp:Transcript_7339/g.10481  ORF Transcript_7339/g.10481 Transcript_7339/m.10481 type:complete len:175 (+) Transcript_7339:159-683(+)